MQLRNTSLEKLVKIFSDNDFKYLTEEVVFKNLELLKEKDVILISIWTVLKELIKKDCLIKMFLKLSKIWNNLVITNMVIMVKN